MANTNIETETVTKGVRLTVIVEYACENIIAVFLMHNGKEYRGVLLESDQGFFPHGIPFSNKPMVEQKASVKSSPRSALDIKPGTENKPPDLTGSKDMKVESPASVGRFSYNTNPFLTNPRPVPDVPTIEMKPVAPRRKTVRDIRLRPRQTLCFKCKAPIHENHKNHSPQVNSQHTVTSATTKLIPPNKSPLKMGVDFVSHSTSSLSPEPRKRKSSLRSPMVLLEDIQLKCMKTSHERNLKEASVSHPSSSHYSRREATCSNIGNKLSDLGGKRLANTRPRSNRSSSSGSINSTSNSSGNDWLQMIEDSETSRTACSSKGSKRDKDTVTASNSKPSPAIKITIGDGAILKIPPRLPEREAQVKEAQVPKIKVLDACAKKAKKAAKRAKDRDKNKTCIIKGESINGMEEDEVVPSKTQKKHKKKHRHRHDSPVPVLSYNEDVAQQPWEENETDSKIREATHGEEEEQNNLSSLMVSGPGGDADNHDIASPVQDIKTQARPRLVYTWRQNQGLSRVTSSPQVSPASVSPKYLIKSSPTVLPLGSSPHRRKNASPARVVSASPSWHFSPSPPGILKDYPLRSKSSSTYSSGRSSDAVPASDCGIAQTDEDSQSHSSGVDSHISDFSDDSGDEESINDFFPPSSSPPREEDDKGIIKPLMMKIQTQNVSGCVLEEGREIRVGDIVWGKIQGFPWWPGRVSNITVTQRDNDVVITQQANVAWFGSNTMSYVHCSDLFPFLEEFKARYNKKKKGQYRVAIKQATYAAQMLAAASQREFTFDDYDL